MFMSNSQWYPLNGGPLKYVCRYFTKIYNPSRPGEAEWGLGGEAVGGGEGGYPFLYE